jgi:class 3 adenylate cyclase
MNLLGTMSIVFAAALFWSKTIENNQSRLQGVLKQFVPLQVASCMLQQQQQGLLRPILHHHDQVSLLSIRVVDGGGGGSGHRGGSGNSAWLLTDFLQEFFIGIDQSVQQHKRRTPLTKVKTMGNVYLVAGGLEEEQEENNNDNDHWQQHCRNVDDYSTTSTTTTMTTTCTGSAVENHHTAQLLRLGAELFPLLDDINRRLGTSFEIRMGLHVGPVVAGVLMNNTQQQQQHSHRRQQLLSYDVWGHAVDVVQDLQLQSLSACGGLVHLSQDAYDKVRHLQDLYLFASRSGSSNSSSKPTAVVALGTKINNTRTCFYKPKLFTRSSSICSIGSSYSNNTTSTTKEYSR